MSETKDKKSLKEILLCFSVFKKSSTLLYIIKWFFISAIIGIVVGSSSALFLLSLDFVTNFRESHVWLIAFLPLGGLAIGLLYHYYGKEVDAGNNLLIDSIHTPKNKIPFRMAPFVYLGTMVTHLLGGSAGREGTALQMAGALSDQFTKLFKLNDAERKILLISAIAAGFGSVFGTPLAGALFGLEVFLIGVIRYNAIFPVFASAILADIVCNLWGVKHTVYSIPFVPKIDILFFIYAIIAGFVFGLCAKFFSKAMHFASSFFKSKITYPPLRPFIGGILVALLVFALGTTKYIGLGIPTILESFQLQEPVYVFALKMMFTILTLSLGFKGGEVTPLFFIGAALGSSLSLLLPLPTALLAGMGFVAVFAGATNTPLACIIIGIELFGVESGVYFAIAVVISYLFSGHTSIYRKQVIGTAKNHHYSAHEGNDLANLN